MSPIASPGTTGEADSVVARLQTRARGSGRSRYAFLSDARTTTLDFAELHRRADRVARALEGCGAVGHRVLLLLPPGPAYLAAFFGCLYAGAVAVPLYPPRRAGVDPRASGVARDCDARFALTAGGQRGDALRMLGEERAATTTAIAVDDLPDDGETGRTWKVAGRDLAFLQYTSGSTGDPKGVMVTQTSLAATLEDMDRGYAHAPDDVIVSWLPLSHDLGLIYGGLQAAWSGCSAVLMTPASFLQKPLRWLRAISDHRGTHSAAPNFAYDLCARRIAEADRADLDLSCWSVSLNAAEPVREDTMRRFEAAFAGCGLRSGVLAPGYGLAEATLKVTATARAAARRTLTVDPAALLAGAAVASDAGRALSGCGASHIGSRVAVVEPDTGAACDDGAVGEIWVRGPAVAAGYWGRRAETEETFGARVAGTGEGPFLRTGDLGFRHEGELYVTGRLKDVVIVDGQNHYPQDIERSAAASHPALAGDGAAAFATGEGEGPERLAVVCEVTRQGLRGLDAEAVSAAVRRAVAEEHGLETATVVLIPPGTLPKTPSGKVRRRACREQFRSGSLRTLWIGDAAGPAGDTPWTPKAGPRDEVAVRGWLRAAVAARSGLAEEAIDVLAPFADHGLDSRALVALTVDLGTWLGMPLSPGFFYDQPSIAAAARQIAGRSAAAGADRSPVGEPIAVVGLACRFPGAPDATAFWRLMCDGRSAAGAVPADRWDAAAVPPAARRGSFLPRIDLFDAPFFGLSRREAERVDPQQRLLLEVAWEAIEAGGIGPDSLAGSKTGVFVGISAGDYMRLQAGAFDGYTATGNAFSIAANRLSYRLDLRGPSLAVDTACSSSLVAVHQACEALRSRDCDLALAGGVSLMLSPDLAAGFDAAGMLAADGRCKTFDAAADGYGRGEGCGLVVLKRLDEAEAAGDDVLAVIRGSAVNQDGRSNGLTAPNGPAQQAVIGAALRRSGLRPGAIGWVECHGTGTRLGDPIEVGAVVAALGDGRDDDRPLRLTSVKPNIGHLEAAAGIAGLIKAVLGLRNGQIPGQAGLGRLNPDLPLRGGAVRIPLGPEIWTGPDRAVGVSSFGFGGTNAHVVLGAAPPASQRGVVPATPVPLCLSARDRSALAELARRYAAALDDRAIAVEDLCFTAWSGRDHAAERLAVVVADRAEAAKSLRAFAAGRRDGAVLLAGDRTHEPDVEGTGAAAARLWLENGRLDPAVFAGGRRRAFLPTTPFLRRRHWFDGSGTPPEAAGLAELRDAFYRVDWRVDVPAPPGPRPSAATYVILADGPGLADALAGRLTAAGHRVVTIRTGADRSRGVADAVASAGTVDGVVCVATAGDPSLDERATAEAVLASQTGAMLPLVGLLRALLCEKNFGLPRLWIVTRGTQRTGHEQRGTSLPHAAAWGFLRALIVEQRALAPVGIDLDPADAGVDAEAGALFAEMGRSPSEDHVAFRGRLRLVARLRRFAVDAGPPPDISPDRCHIVTGGTGALGLHVAGWLAERGARDIVLLGRRAADPALDVRLEPLRAAGARVEVRGLDVADQEGMAALLSDLATAGRSPGGVMHLAGRMDDVYLGDLSPERFEAVLRPKVLGAWILHRLTEDLPLDYFVLFSSTTAVVGGPAQGAYGAANSFLDALAGWRRGRGLPALSVAWGPWEGGGMAEALSRANLQRFGVRPMAAGSALRALGIAMRSAAPEATVAGFDWDAMARNNPWVRSRPFLAEVTAPPPPARPGPLPGRSLEALLDEVGRLSPGDILSLIDRAAEDALA